MVRCLAIPTTGQRQYTRKTSKTNTFFGKKVIDKKQKYVKIKDKTMQQLKSFKTKKDYYLQKSFKHTEDFFSQINELHGIGGEYSVIAGEMFEQFNMIKLPEIISNVTNIWDTNDINNIPNNVITEIFGHLEHKKIDNLEKIVFSYIMVSSCIKF